jgi:hypothetical protein
MVYRGLNNHLIAFFRKFVEGKSNSFHYAGHKGKTFFFYRQMMPFLQPINNGTVILRRRKSIAKNAVFDLLFQRFNNAGR